MELKLDGRHWSNIEIINCYDCSFQISKSARVSVCVCWEGVVLGQYGDLELLKSFCYRIQDGRHGGHLESLQFLSVPEW